MLLVTLSLICLAVTIAPASEGRVPRVRFNLVELPTSKRALHQLAADVSFFWEQKPLREGLRDLSDAHGISIWLDRRIDPNQLISVKINALDADQSLNAALRKIAILVQAEAALIENVVYLGPKNRPKFLQRAAVELHDALSQKAENNAAQMRGLSWRELATPNDLLAEISDQWKVAIEGKLPHDLLHAGKLVGQSTLATQLTVLCGGFEMEAQLQGERNIQLVPLKGDDRWQALYPKESLNAKTLESSNLNRLRREYPQSGFRESGEQCEVLATTNFHLALLKPSTAGKRPDADLGQQRWTFEVKNKPAQEVIQFFANSIGFEVMWDPNCSANDRGQLVNFRVENAGLDALLAEFAKSSQLTVKRQDLTVLISP